jgi:hypothetical protein
MSIEPDSQSIIARIVPSKSERMVGTLEPETIRYASQRFRIDGAVLIEDIVDIAVIAQARRAFDEAYSNYLDGCARDDALIVGDRRLIITINLEAPFDNPQFFANPYLLPVLREALDDGFVLGALGIVCSLASAPGQHRHADGGDLFPRSGIDKLLPASAITVVIPLLEMNEVHGTTALWLGSHRDASRAKNSEEAIRPIVREGSCMLWDFRLTHGGTPNRSASPRPLLYLTYCRPWFLDHVNFGTKNPRQKPLVAKKNLWLSLSEQHQRLLIRTREDYAYPLNGGGTSPRRD